MRTTRSSKAAAADAPKQTPPPTSKSKSKSKYCLTSKHQQPSKLFVLPREATASAKIVALPHPRNGQPSRYLVCPETGIYEFTKVAAPKKTAPRSWLMTWSSSSPAGEKEEEEEAAAAPNRVDGAETMTSADLFIATYYDPLFLLLPALVDIKASSSSSSSMTAADKKKPLLFLSSDDYFDRLAQDAPHLLEILQWPKTRALLESRMAAVCDTVDAGGESMFRVNQEKLFSLILAKARRLSSDGLPASMEEKVVEKALEAPIMLRSTKKVHGATATATAAAAAAAATATATATATAPAAGGDESNTTKTPKTESAAESQSSTATEGSTLSAISSLASTAASSTTFSAADEATAAAEDAVVSALTASAQVVQLQRLRVAFDFICASCIPHAIAEQLKQQLGTASCSTEEDFAPLDAFMSELARLRKEALAARSLDGFSRKRMTDEEADEARMEKKKKMEEDNKKRKANESRGVRDLKKVNTSGMKKLSAFFAKK